MSAAPVITYLSDLYDVPESVPDNHVLVKVGANWQAVDVGELGGSPTFDHLLDVEAASGHGLWRRNDDGTYEWTTDPNTLLGQASGFASLDSSALVPDAQIPTLAQSKITNLTSDLAAKEVAANKGVANGYASLDSSSLIPTAQVPWSSQTATGAITINTGTGGSGDWILQRNGTEKLRVSSTQLIPAVQYHRDDVGGSFGDTGSFLNHRRLVTAPNGIQTAHDVYMQGKGTKTDNDRITGIVVRMDDATGVGNWTVSGAANNGSGLIRLTVTGHGFATGDLIAVYGVGGTTEANAWWVVTVINANTIDLQGSTFTHAYTSGGTATNRPMMYCFGAQVTPAVDRIGLTGTAVDADDVNCFVGFNRGPGKATDAWYLGRNSTITGSEWATCFTMAANADFGLRMLGAYASFGLDFQGGTYTGGALRLPNAVGLYGRDSGNANDRMMMQITSGNELQLGNQWGNIFVNGTLRIQDAFNIQFGSTTGGQIGTSSTQKIGFWGKGAVVRPTGWTAWTGTATRTSVATSTATTTQVAQALKALIDDLISIGLIGA